MSCRASHRSGCSELGNTWLVSCSKDVLRPRVGVTWRVEVVISETEVWSPLWEGIVSHGGVAENDVIRGPVSTDGPSRKTPLAALPRAVLPSIVVRWIKEPASEMPSPLRWGLLCKPLPSTTLNRMLLSWAALANLIPVRAVASDHVIEKGVELRPPRSPNDVEQDSRIRPVSAILSGQLDVVAFDGVSVDPVSVRAEQRDATEWAVPANHVSDELVPV